MSLHVMPQQPFASNLKWILKGLHRVLRHTLEVFIIRRNLQSFNFKMGLALTPLLIALLLPGCAIVNPNVTLPRPDSATKEYSLSEGIQYAEGAIKKYDNYIASNNWFSGTIGVLMIGASAAALALGITDGGTTAIAALGVSGASLFGIGTFLTDSSRNTIYNEGKEKVICAIAAVQPLLLSPEKIVEFRKSLNNVKKGIPQVQKAIETVLREKEKVKDEMTLDSLLNLVSDKIQSSNVIIAAAESAYEAGTKLDLQLSRTGNSLITAVDGINTEVNRRLDGTVASLESANTIIGGLASVSTRLTAIPEKAVMQAETAREEIVSKSLGSARGSLIPEEKNLVEALDALVKSTVSLAREVAFVATIVAEVQPSLVNLGQCKLNLQELTLSVKPDAIEFTAGIPGTRRLIILTGKKPFAAQLLEHPVTGLTIEQPVPFGSTVDVVATDKVVAGEYTVHIVDGAERNVFIKILVNKQ